MMRHQKPLLNVSVLCDGCGAIFDVSHALSCRKGGLITKGHNEAREVIDDLSALVIALILENWLCVRGKPIG